MKRYYFSKNSFTGEYFLDGGFFQFHRKYLSKEEPVVIDYLKKNLNLSRKTEFIVLEKGVSDSLIKRIEETFSKSKIKVTLGSKIKKD